MEKLSRLATLLVLTVSFGAPMLASAVTCTPGCGAGLTCDAPTGTCVLDSAASGSGIGGGVNTIYLGFYKSLIQGTVNSYLVPILIAIAFIVFLFGVYKYFIQGAADEKNREDGRKFVLWGIIGFVVITSIWGIVNLVSGTIVPSSADQNHPKYPTL